MCLYPRLIRNPKYKKNKKNGGNVPTAKDARLLYVPIGCGKCEECRRQKANEWQVRLTEELNVNPNAYFITLTFDEEHLNNELELSMGNINEAATHAVRLFLERWRGRYGKSPKHWLITELGHQNTERLHLHGLLWCDCEQIDKLEEIWGNGWIYIGDYVTLRTINYISKYITKLDQDHIDYEGKILCSKGIGANYMKREKHLNIFNGANTKDYYKLPNGNKTNLPIYYRNHLYNDEQKEDLWLAKLDQHTIFVRGIACSVATAEDRLIYEEVLRQAQKDNKKLGYGGPDKWHKKDYKKILTKLQKL